MPCTVHCLVSDDEQLAPMRERIARAGIADERVYVVWRGPETRTPAGATLRAWGFMLAPAAWWWSQAMREWLIATEHVVAPRGDAAAAAQAPAQAPARQPAIRGRGAAKARGKGAGPAAKSGRAGVAAGVVPVGARKTAASSPRLSGRAAPQPSLKRPAKASPLNAAKPARRGRIPGSPASLSSSACLHAKVTALRRANAAQPAAAEQAASCRPPLAADVRKAARRAKAARLAAARSANGRPPLRVIEGGLQPDSAEDPPPSPGSKRRRRSAGGRSKPRRAAGPAAGTKTATLSPATPRGGGAGTSGAAAAAPSGTGTRTTRTRGGKTGVGAPVPGRGRRSGPA